MTVDELIVKIVLDASGFLSGQKATTDAADALKAKTVAAANAAEKGQSAAAEKARKAAEAEAKKIQEANAKTSESVVALGRRVLGLYALFTAGRGVKEFVSDITSADAALGRVAKNVDLSGKALSTWQGAATVAGGSAEGITNSIASLSNAMQTAALTGNNTLAPVFRALGVDLADTGGKARDIGEVLKGLNRSYNEKHIDPARFSTMMKMVGADDGTINLLERSTESFDKLLKEQEKYAANAADIEAAQKRQTGWRELLNVSTSLGRTILTELTPAITGVMRAVINWANANQEWLKHEIVTKVQEFIGWLKSLDWTKIGDDFRAFATSVGALAAAFAGVVAAVSGQSPLAVAFEAFGALLALRILAPLTSILSTMRLIGGLPLTGALSLLTGVGGIAAAAVVASTSPLNAGEPQVRSDGTMAYPDGHTEKGKVWDGHSTTQAPKDERNWWQRTMPKIVGGQDAPMVAHGMHGANLQERRSASNNTEVSDYIAKAAAARGIDPRIALKVADSEGLRGYNPNKPDHGGDKGTSFGPFQLHYKSNIAGFTNAGMGDDFTKATGKHASDPSTWREQADFALDHAAKHGWSNWHGWRGPANAGLNMDPTEAAKLIPQRAPQVASSDNAQPSQPQQPFATSGGQVSRDISNQATYNHGQLDSTQGLIFHHTGGRGTPEGVVQTLNQRGYGVQYVMDRDGSIVRTLPEGARGAHILRSEINGLNNSNSQGVEVIAKDDKDVTPAQVASGKAFAEAMTKRYPGLEVFGHGEVNPHHKQATEGMSIVAAVRQDQAAPKVDPNFKPAPIPQEQRTLAGYMGRDFSPISSAEAKEAPYHPPIQDDRSTRARGKPSPFPGDAGQDYRARGGAQYSVPHAESAGDAHHPEATSTLGGTRMLPAGRMLTLDDAANHVLKTMKGANDNQHPVKVDLTDGSATKIGVAGKSGFDMLMARHSGALRTHVGAELKKSGAEMDRAFGKAWTGLGHHAGIGAGERAWQAVNHAHHQTTTHHVDNSSATHVGEMHVHPQTGDGKQFARDFRDGARQRSSVVTQANAGLA